MKTKRGDNETKTRNKKVLQKEFFENYEHQRVISFIRIQCSQFPSVFFFIRGKDFPLMINNRNKRKPNELQAERI